MGCVFGVREGLREGDTSPGSPDTLTSRWRVRSSHSSGPVTTCSRAQHVYQHLLEAAREKKSPKFLSTENRKLRGTEHPFLLTVYVETSLLLAEGLWLELGFGTCGAGSLGSSGPWPFLSPSGPVFPDFFHSCHWVWGWVAARLWGIYRRVPCECHRQGGDRDIILILQRRGGGMNGLNASTTLF